MNRVTRDIRALMAQAAEPSPALAVHVQTTHRYHLMLSVNFGPYAHVPLFFSIEPGHQYGGGSAPYPAAPPRVLHYSPHRIRIHPNLYTAEDGGKVCLSILGTWSGPSWTALMTFDQITTMISALLHDDALRCEPGYESGRPEKVQNYAKAVAGVTVRTTLQLMRRVLASAAPAPYAVKLAQGEMDLAEFRDELAILFLKNREHYAETLRRFPAGTKVDTVYGGSEVLSPGDDDLAAVTAALAGATLRRLAVRVLTTLPPATVATMCIADHPDRTVEVVAIEPGSEPVPDPPANTLTIVVATPDEHKKYPAAQHVPVAGSPQHITENVRSILAAEATRILVRN